MQLKKDIEIFEGERAQNYDEFVLDYFPSYNFVMDAIPKIIKEQTEATEKSKILVAGCGTGNETKKLLDFDATWWVDACDPSQEMIDQAKTKLQDYKNDTIVRGTVDTLSSKPRYDVATLLLVLHFFSNDGAKLKLLKSIFMRLKPKGKLLLLDICGTKTEILENFEILEGLFPKQWSKEEVEQRKEKKRKEKKEL